MEICIVGRVLLEDMLIYFRIRCKITFLEHTNQLLKIGKSFLKKFQVFQIKKKNLD